MNPETQFKNFTVFIILIIAAYVIMNSSYAENFNKIVRTTLQQTFFSDSEVVIKEDKDNFWTKLSHNLNPKKYWISGNIKINGLSDYNLKTSEQIYMFRKYYVNKTIFKNKNYVPDKEVFGNIKENGVWLGVKAYSCIGPNTLSYKSMTKESKFINNPAVLIGIDYASFPKKFKRCNDSDYLIPKTLSFSKDNNNFVLTYTIPEEQKQRNFKLVGLNARDLGFKYGYCRKTNNIVFANNNDNISKNIYQFKDALRPDASCGVKGGCNSNVAFQEELFFNMAKSPATFEFKLWKEKPESLKKQSDINFTVILE